MRKMLKLFSANSCKNSPCKSLSKSDLLIFTKLCLFWESCKVLNNESEYRPWYAPTSCSLTCFCTLSAHFKTQTLIRLCVNLTNSTMRHALFFDQQVWASNFFLRWTWITCADFSLRPHVSPACARLRLTDLATLSSRLAPASLSPLSSHRTEKNIPDSASRFDAEYYIGDHEASELITHILRECNKMLSSRKCKIIWYVLKRKTFFHPKKSPGDSFPAIFHFCVD